MNDNDGIKFVDTEVFGSAALAYIGDEVEINLPEWSGRMSKADARGELARLKEFISQVESALDESVEAVSVPVGGDTDSAAADVSWRAEVVESALEEDERAAYEALMGDSQDYEDAMEREIEDTRELFAALHAQSLAFWATAAGQRRHAHNRRKMAIYRGARPYQAAFELSRNIAVFEGEIHRVISLVDDIPF